MTAFCAFLFSCFLTVIPHSLDFTGRGRTDYRELGSFSVDISAPVINGMAQDSSGLIWLCTNRGLYAYDGYNVYACNDAGYNTRVQIQCAELVGNVLWLGTDRGMLLYDTVSCRYVDDHPALNVKGIVRSVCRFHGKVYMGNSSGISCYDPATGALSEVKITDSRGYGLSIYSILEVDGILYFGTFDGLYSLGSDMTVDKIRGLEKNVFVYSMCHDPVRNFIWLGTQDGLWGYDLAAGQYYPVGSIRHQVINDIVLDRDSSLVIGTDSGVYIYRNSMLRHLEHEVDNSASLCDNDIESLFVDRDGNVWIGTNNGVSIAKYWNLEEFISMRSITGSPKGMVISTMVNSEDGDLWCGGSSGIVHVPHGGADPEVFDIYSKGKALPHNIIRSIKEDGEGGIWAATDGGALYFDKRKDVFRRLDMEVSSYNAEWCHDIAVDDERGKVWIGTFSSGIYVYDRDRLKTGAGNALEMSFHDEIRTKLVKQIEIDDTGAAWVLYYNENGMARISPEGGILDLDFSGYIGNETIPTRMVSDCSGNIWAGYDNGVLCIDTHSMNIIDISFPQRSDGMDVLSMASSGDNIWLSTASGIVWEVDSKSGTVRKLPLQPARYTSMCYDKDERTLLLGTNDGFCRISVPVAYPENREGRVYFMSVEINGDSYMQTGRNDSIPGLGLRYTGEIVLAHDENDVTVSFSSMNYTSQFLDQFAYRLEPVSKNWIPLKDGINTISLANMHSGMYWLSVCQLDETGVPQEETMGTLKMTLRPSVMMSPMAFVIYLLAIAGIIFWIIHYYRIKARLRAAGFEKEVLTEQVSEKMEFLTGISHDLKTPLSLIMGPVSRILMSPGNEQIKGQLEMVMKNAERLNTLLGKMLDLKRSSSETEETLVRSAVDLSELVGGVLSRYMDEAAAHKIKVSFNCQEKHIFYNCDPYKMESIADNLISNAFKYTGDNGDIHISLYVDGHTDKLYFTVTDSGIGIPDSEQKYIFQRFFQSSVTRGKVKGNGLGLYLVKKYVEAHGGSIDLSSHIGQGTSFILEFPFRSYAVEVSHKKESPAAEHKPYRVLVVEDNEDLSSFVADFLSDTADVYTAWNGRDGLTLFRRLNPDLVIADMMMPIMDGMELCRRIRSEKNGKTVPLIMLTAKTDPDTEAESIRSGVDCFMSKPFNVEHMRLKVMSLLESHARLAGAGRTAALPVPKAPEVQSQNEKFLSEVTRIIEENISHPDLNVSFLSEKTGISTRQLSRRLKPLTGLNPVDYIKNIRIKQASVMLDQGHFTVAEVMYSVGFSDPSYFAKCFQQEFGCTPSQYLKSKK